MPKFSPLHRSWGALAALITLSWSASAAESVNPLPTLATGSAHACAIRDGGIVWCWGRNLYGLGDGVSTERQDPVQVLGLPEGITAITAGSSHTCALDAEGAVWCWGADTWGQLGDGPAVNHPGPAVPVAGTGRKIQMIAAGWDHTCALDAEGAVWCWGYNGLGQLGDGTKAVRRTPVQVINLPRDIQYLTAGGTHSCALDLKGQLWCWGSGISGELGNGIRSDRPVPDGVNGTPGKLKMITSGVRHGCALESSGDIWCWGSNMEGQLGHGEALESPRKVMGLPSSMRAVAAGGLHSCALDSNERVWCWGWNRFGQTGRPVSYEELPAQVPGLPSGIKALSAGHLYSCALGSEGAVWCWGRSGPTPMQVRLPPPQVSSPNIAAPGIEEPELPGPTPTLPPKDDSEMYDEEF